MSGFKGQNYSVDKKKQNSFNMSNIYTEGMNQFKQGPKLPFEIINFISILIGIGALVSYFFIPFYYSLLICVGGILISVILRTRRISGIVVNFLSFFLILIIVLAVFLFNSISKFVKHHIIKKDVETSIVYNYDVK